MSDITGTKISQLPLGENLADDDLMLAVEDGISKKVEIEYLKNRFVGDLTLADLGDDSTHRLVTDAEKTAWSGKQDALTFDNAPTSGSSNPVKSSGIYTALGTKANTSDLATVATSGSYNDLSNTPTIPSDAGDIDYDNTESGLTADDVQDAIDELAQNSGGDSDVIIVPENAGYISSTGAIAAASSSNHEVYTEPIPAQKDDIVSFDLEYELTQSMWVAYATYGENHEFISRIMLVNSVQQKEYSTNITIPANVYYIRFTYRTYGMHDVNIQTDSKNRLVSNVIIGETNNKILSARFPFTFSNIIQAGYASSTDSWNLGVKNRCAVTTLQYTPEDLPLCMNVGFQVAYHTRTKDGTFVSDSGWIRTPLVIPAGTYYTLMISKEDGSNLTPNEAIENVYASSAISNELSSSYNKITNSIVLNSIYNDSKNAFVKAVNHRGYNYTMPENTIPAFKESRAKGFYYVECDVEYTSDGVPVILHDSSINRTARNADGTAISETVNIYDITYEQALDYDFGIWKGAEFAGTKLPTLKQFISLCKNIGLHPYIEIKAANSSQQLVEKCVEIVRKAGMDRYVTWISTSKVCLAYIKNVLPNARLGLVVSNVTSTAISDVQTLKTSNNDVFIDSSTYTSAEIEMCYDADIPLEVWTIDDYKTAISLDSYITGVTSNIANVTYLLYGNNTII